MSISGHSHPTACRIFTLSRKPSPSVVALTVNFLLCGLVFFGWNSTHLRASTELTNITSPEFAASRWTTAQGLLKNTVTALRQTDDGYLWAETTDGFPNAVASPKRLRLKN